MIKNNKKNYLKFIKKNDLTLFNIDPHSLRGKNFFKSIFQYREKIFKIQKKRIEKAFLKSSSEEVLFFENVLKKIINE